MTDSPAVVSCQIPGIWLGVMEQLNLWKRRLSATTTQVQELRDPPPLGERSADNMARWLAVHTSRPVSLILTKNRSTMLSCRELKGALKVRLHTLFLEAPAEIWFALAAYLGWDHDGAGSVLDAYIAQKSKEIPRHPVAVRPVGRFHDLQRILEELNNQYFHGACGARITWGQANSRRGRRSIQLGCYVGDDNLIRIHPCLDQAFVPERYVAWVVFHEMLHEVFGVEQKGGRRSLHPPEFVAFEESYPDYRACKAWEQKNLPRLLSWRPPRKS